MRALPEDLDAAALTSPLLDAWGVEIESTHYAPVGGGSYHWIVEAREGTRYFATVDDLERKPWLGDFPDTAFAGLRQAFDASAALSDGGLEFVLAPIRSAGGATLTRIAPRYSLALFPFVEGEAGTFGRYDADERAAILAMLQRLHQATADVCWFEVELPGRRALEDALLTLDRPWTGGPLGEPTRAVLAEHATHIAELLARYDRLAAQLPAQSDWVVTHGEPHAGNVIRTGERYVLVDWDTVARAPAGRDLWMLADDEVDGGFFDLRWDLADLASFTSLLRAAHSENADSTKALAGISTVLRRER